MQCVKENSPACNVCYMWGCFFIHRKLRPMNEKALRAGCASRGEEVSCKQHRSSAKESQATLLSLRKNFDKKNENGEKSHHRLTGKNPPEIAFDSPDRDSEQNKQDSYGTGDQV